MQFRKLLTMLAVAALPSFGWACADAPVTGIESSAVQKARPPIAAGFYVGAYDPMELPSLDDYTDFWEDAGRRWLFLAHNRFAGCPNTIMTTAGGATWELRKTNTYTHSVTGTTSNYVGERMVDGAGLIEYASGWMTCSHGIGVFHTP